MAKKNQQPAQPVNIAGDLLARAQEQTRQRVAEYGALLAKVVDGLATEQDGQKLLDLREVLRVDDADLSEDLHILKLARHRESELMTEAQLGELKHAEAAAAQHLADARKAAEVAESQWKEASTAVKRQENIQESAPLSIENLKRCHPRVFGEHRVPMATSERCESVAKSSSSPASFPTQYADGPTETHRDAPKNMPVEHVNQRVIFHPGKEHPPVLSLSGAFASEVGLD